MSSFIKAASWFFFLILSLASCVQADGTRQGVPGGGPAPSQRQGVISAPAGHDRRAQDIKYDLAAFARTGEYGFLCHAALLGSKEAAGRLEKDGIACSPR